MDDKNEYLRMSDEELQQYADNVLWDYDLNIKHGVYTMPKTPLAVRELVLRELERREKKKGDDPFPEKGKEGRKDG